MAETANPSVTFTGFFHYDTLANAGGGSSSDFSITMLTGGSPDFTWSPSNSFGGFPGSGGGTPVFETGTNAPLPFTGVNLAANFPNAFDGSVSTIALEGAFGDGCNGSFFYAGGACSFGTVGLQGSLTTADVSAVPLPAALPLFGSAVLGLAGFGARKSRRTRRG